MFGEIYIEIGLEIVKLLSFKYLKHDVELFVDLLFGS